ncbi:MAG: SOS response-associated peptidase family protein [Gallicola sp.]|nr:SOS response-associated peptidase family protein [Gallicola sp.]
MCGRFYLDPEDIRELRTLYSLRDKKEYSPGMEIYYREKGSGFQKDLWGIQTDFLNRLIINSRIEKLYPAGFFLEDFIERRCIIPASYFFEWKKSGKTKTRYEIGVKESSYFYLAGLYRLNEEGKKELSILTNSSFGEMESIHHRMPILLRPSEGDSYLEESPEILIKELWKIKPDFIFRQKDPEQLGFL